MRSDSPVNNTVTSVPQLNPQLGSLGRERSRLDLEGVVLDKELIASFPSKTLFESCSIPIQKVGDRVRIAISDLHNYSALDELTAFSGFMLDPVLGDATQIKDLLRQTLGVGGGTVGDASDRTEHAGELELQAVLDASENASIVRFTRELLQDAYLQRASDIHLEPEERELIIRFRIDGVLRPQNVPSEIHSHREAIISRLKILAKLNIAEKRLPQDGGFSLQMEGHELDVRLSVIPMRHGEGIVLRLLDKSRMNFSLDQLGFGPEMRKTWESLLTRTSGMVLVTGPTGSGKTTTLYGSIALLRGPDLKIITLEDPIEYTMTGVNQIQVQSGIGLTFAAGLRSVLRHDPDVILLGEIRDQETATHAVQSALTGHMVLSTVHTNDAASAVTRLVDMGIEPFLVAATLNGVLAQRLVRKLCSRCRQPVQLSKSDLPAGFPCIDKANIFAPKGCRACHGIGYLGQIAVYELMVVDDQVRKLCIQGAAPQSIREHATEFGMRTMRQAGWQHVLDGITSIDEILRATSEEA